MRTDGRKCLIIVLPYLVGFGSASDKKKKEVRSFLAFPYGALTIASYVNKNSSNGSRCEILDLNITINLGKTDEEIKQAVFSKIDEVRPQVVGFSMSFDVSFTWLKRLSDHISEHFPTVLLVAGGPAITTGYRELISLLPKVSGFCFSEGESALLNLLDSDKGFDESLRLPPWITQENLESSNYKPDAVYVDLDEVIDVDYELVDVESYSMREAFSPFTKFQEGAPKFDTCGRKGVFWAAFWHRGLEKSIA